MPLAAYLAALQSSPDGGTFTSVPGVTSFDISPENDELDTLALGGGGAQARIHGLTAWKAKISGDYVDGNVGQSNFLKNEGNRCDLKAFYSDGTALQMLGIVEGYDFDLNAKGKLSMSASINGNGAVVVTTSAAPAPTDTPIAVAIPGYSGTVKLPGTSTVAAGEACSLVSGKTYRITNAVKRVIDPAVAVVVKDNAIAVADANIASIDYLGGQVTFVAAYTPTLPITMDINYLPLLAVAECTQFKVSVKNKLLDKTSVDSAGIKQYLKGIREASGSFQTLTPLTADNDPGAGTFRLTDSIVNKTKVLFELNLGIGTTFRCWALAKANLKLSPASIQQNGISFASTAQARGRDEAAFGWVT